MWVGKHRSVDNSEGNCFTKLDNEATQSFLCELWEALSSHKVLSLSSLLWVLLWEINRNVDITANRHTKIYSPATGAGMLLIHFLCLIFEWCWYWTRLLFSATHKGLLTPGVFRTRYSVQIQIQPPRQCYLRYFCTTTPLSTECIEVATRRNSFHL